MLINNPFGNVPRPAAGDDPTDEQLDWIMRAAASDARARAAVADAELQAAIAHEVARATASPMVTEKSKADGTIFMKEFRAGSAAALLSRIERKELLTSAELQDALKIRPQFINNAVKSNRLFALLGPSDEHYYPAFYVDPSLDRRAIEKVSKAMGSIPGAAKYNFFTEKSHMLGATPLEALRQGRVAEVLVAATVYGD
jgi:hypothetical protein